MKKSLLLLAVCLGALFSACHRDPHFISDRDYRDDVHSDFEARMRAFPMLDLRLDTLSRSEREAMEFLYAYMPLSDLADYDAHFFLDQVRYAFRARSEMSWGHSVPEDVFRHFVLVYRVNNENLDTARMFMFRELKERVQGMPMEQAALEVNHWCHEHVAYRASDGRTSAPLATMRTSLGRCGEESTFTVTALRSVGIPARQCYTPRWAHCDDNHAWVEVWVDGQWKYCGACEPDPRLDMGWFSIPSTRCMMVHSKAFGRYHGDEEVVRRTGLFSELNLLSHYAPTRRVSVTVCDINGQPVPDAKVKFKLYNYAEYYTLSTQTADASGCASLTTGLGDLLVWATDGSRFAFQKLDVRTDSTITITLTDAGADPLYVYDIVPPVAGNPKVVASQDEVAANAIRLAYEDSLRAAYTATFPTRDNYQSLLNLTQTDTIIWDFIRRSEGNYAAIADFLRQSTDYDYLRSFSDKDLRDITTDVLIANHTSLSDHSIPHDIFCRGILPARISNEMVRPFRTQLARFRGLSAGQIRQWVVDSITVDDTSNYFGCPVSPTGVLRLRHADAHSRDIFFVAACRAAGVPAYLDNATNELFVYNNASWERVTLGTSSGAAAPMSQATLTLTYRGSDPAKPIYWPHFTLAKLENGDLRTFDFEDDPRMANFPASLSLEPGIYCLSTGNRYADGSVRSRLQFFELKAGDKASLPIVILPLLARTDVLGLVDKNMELFDGIALWDYAGKAGMLYVNLGEYSEPSKHLIVELRSLQKEMRQWGGMTFMVGPTSAGMPAWQLVNTDFAYQKGQLEQSIVDAARIQLNNNYPLVALIDAEGRIRYHSEGYKIGVIEQVLKAATQASL